MSRGLTPWDGEQSEGLFPPVALDDYLYVDGGAAMQVVGGIEHRGWVYSQERQERLDFVEDGRPIRIRV